MLRKYYLLGSIALFFLSGCASVTSNPASHNNKHHNKQNKQSDEITDKDIAPHVLAIDPDGKLNLIGCDGEGKDKPKWCESTDAYIDNIITNLKKENKELLIYVHGGLNSEENALERAKKKYRLILEKGVEKIPLFVFYFNGLMVKCGILQLVDLACKYHLRFNTLLKIKKTPDTLSLSIGNPVQ